MWSTNGEYVEKRGLSLQKLREKRRIFAIALAESKKVKRTEARQQKVEKGKLRHYGFEVEGGDSALGR
jgi:hypothetical protein